MKIRAISRDELDMVKNLWEGLNAHHLSRSTHFRDHYSKFTFEKRTEILKNRSLIAYVAEDNNECIGYCIATVDALVGEIDSLFVSERFRRRGLGEKLMFFALGWLEGQECDGIRVAIAEGNEHVLDFYKRFGFFEETDSDAKECLTVG